MKRKQKRKHLESTDSQETVKMSRRKFNVKKCDVQHRHKVVALTQRQKVGAASSSSSEYFSCISSEDKLIGAGFSDIHKHAPQSEYPLEDSTLVHEERDTSSASEYFSCDSSIHMFSSADNMKMQMDVPQPDHIPKEQRKALSISEYFSCISFRNKNNRVSGFNKCPSQSGHSGLSQDHSQGVEDDSVSEYFSCVSSVDLPIHNVWKSEDDVTQPRTNVVVPAWSQASAENSSASEYFSCVSSACKLTLVNKTGTHRLHQDIPCLASSEMPLLQDLEKRETSSPFPHVSFPYHSVYKTCMSSVHMTEKKRVMKVYYMRVQMKRGVAVLWDTEEGLEPLKKKARIEEMSFPEKNHTPVNLSHVSTEELLTDSESSLKWEAQEEMEEADSPEEPPGLEESSRGRTPDWLVTLDSGFRCMACCRVFPSLEVLQEHVEHGVNEGFSCHAFHLALAWLNNKRHQKAKKKRRKRKKIKRKTSESHQEKNFGMRTSSYK